MAESRDEVNSDPPPEKVGGEDTGEPENQQTPSRKIGAIGGAVVGGTLGAILGPVGALGGALLGLIVGDEYEQRLAGQYNHPDSKIKSSHKSEINGFPIHQHPASEDIDMSSGSETNVGKDISETKSLESVDPTIARTPTILILDTSASMLNEIKTSSGETTTRIDQLNESLQLFADEVEKKEHSSTRVDIAIVAFGGGVEVVQNFTPVEEWTPPKLSAEGGTPMGKAIEEGIDLAEEIKTTYNQEGIEHTRPLLWLLTDGKPTDMHEGDQMWTRVQEQLERGTNSNQFHFFAMGCGEADMEILNTLVEVTDRPALKIREGVFDEYFVRV